MFRRLGFAGIYAALFFTAVFAQAAQYRTAEEARAMLEKEVAAVKLTRKMNSGTLTAT